MRRQVGPGTYNSSPTQRPMTAGYARPTASSLAKSVASPDSSSSSSSPPVNSSRAKEMTPFIPRDNQPEEQQPWGRWQYLDAKSNSWRFFPPQDQEILEWFSLVHLNSTNNSTTTERAEVGKPGSGTTVVPICSPTSEAAVRLTTELFWGARASDRFKFPHFLRLPKEFGIMNKTHCWANSPLGVVRVDGALPLRPALPTPFTTESPETCSRWRQSTYFLRSSPPTASSSPSSSSSSTSTSPSTSPIVSTKGKEKEEGEGENKQEEERGLNLLDLPDSILVMIMGYLLNTKVASCSCHKGQMMTDEAVYALCALEMTCKRFHNKCKVVFQQPTDDASSTGAAASSSAPPPPPPPPLPASLRRQAASAQQQAPKPVTQIEVSLAERAARVMCKRLWDNNKKKRAASRNIWIPELASPATCWKHQLLLEDTEAQLRSHELKSRLHNLAFNMRETYTFIHEQAVREAAEAEIVRRWGVVDASVRSSFRENGRPSCFTGDGIVQLADGTTKTVEETVVGDMVRTESGFRAIAKIDKRGIFGMAPTITVGDGVVLTTGHPVFDFVAGEWTHPFEMEGAVVVKRYIEYWYNYELAGGPTVTDHSVWINNVLVATLGKDCGERIRTGWLKEENKYGTGYWTNGNSLWEHTQLTQQQEL